MRQTHAAGERMFVDYAGQTIDFVDGRTGEVIGCQLFVAVLGASSYTYVEATLTQSLPDWCASHERTFLFFGGVPGQIVSDNLKAGITKACFYEPTVNKTYADLAAHYNTVVVPARPYKPRDKAKAEVGVQLAERWIIAKLRPRITARTVEVFHRGKRVACHIRSSSNRKHTTVGDHMPKAHQRYAAWTPERICAQAVCPTTFGYMRTSQCDRLVNGGAC